MQEEQASVPRTRRPQQTHRGRTLDERRAERRAALLDAALELFGTKGFAATSIGELCKTSYVATRYFYEEYGDRDSLLLALYDKLIEQVNGPVLAVNEPPGDDHVRRSARARISAFVHGTADDERIARVLLLESGSAIVENRRRQAHEFFAKFIAQLAFPYVEAGDIRPYDVELVSLMYVGAINEAVSNWVLTPPEERHDLEYVIDNILEVFLLIRAGLET